MHAIRYWQFESDSSSGSPAIRKGKDGSFPGSNAGKQTDEMRALRGNGKPMSKSLKERLTAVIGPLLRSERRGRGTQGGPMKNESIAFAVKEPYATSNCEKIGAGVMPLEVLGRSLGYTRKELVVAGEVLNRFVWRRPVSDDSEKTLEDKAHKAA